MEVLLQSRVQVRETGASNTGVLQRIRTQYIRVRGQHAKGGRIEVISRWNILARIAGDDQITESGIVAAGERKFTRDLPSSDKRIGNSWHAGQKALASTERKFVRTRGNDSVMGLVTVLPLQLILKQSLIIEGINLAPFLDEDVSKQEIVEIGR